MNVGSDELGQYVGSGELGSKPHEGSGELGNKPHEGSGELSN